MAWRKLQRTAEINGGLKEVRGLQTNRPIHLKSSDVGTFSDSKKTKAWQDGVNTSRNYQYHSRHRSRGTGNIQQYSVNTVLDEKPTMALTCVGYKDTIKINLKKREMYANSWTSLGLQ